MSGYAGFCTFGAQFRRILNRQQHLMAVPNKNVNPRKSRILYFYPALSSFVRRDIAVLSERHDVRTFGLDLPGKFALPGRLLAQMLFILRHGRGATAFICHFAGYASLLPVLLGRMLGVRCYVVVAGTDAACFPAIGYGNYTRRLLGFATRVSLRHASGILPVHHSLVRQAYTYHEAGSPAQGFAVFAPGSGKTPVLSIPYGYDEEVFRSNGAIHRNPGTFVSVGDFSVPTLWRRKGFDLIVALARKRPELSFTLVGWDGKARSDLPENVRLRPFLSQPELVDELSAHEYYFQLSIMEGFPNALAEAMLCGCIPIGSAVSAIPDMIGDAGYLLYRCDAGELDSLLNRALADPRRGELPALARQAIAGRFTLQRRREALEAVIGSGIAGAAAKGF